MKNLLSTLLLLLMILLLSVNNLLAQSADRTFILDKIRIYYIPHPNTPPYEVHTIPMSRVLNNSTKIFGTATENGMDNTALFLRQLCQPVSSGSNGQPLLQQMVAAVLRITSDSVVVYIYNDRDPLNAYAKAHYLGTGYSDEHVWPAAWRGDSGPGTRERPNPGTNHTGYIQFGESYVSEHGITEMRRTFVHEVTHTQDFSHKREHVWGAFRYGADGSHYVFELVPNIADAFGEGIANSMVYLYSRASRSRVLTWFGTNDLCAIESVIPASSSVPRSGWLYTQVSAVNPPGPGGRPADARLDGLGYRLYNLYELPARFLMHNEQIIGMIGSEYARRIGKPKYFQAIRSGNGRMFRVSTNALARWFEALSEAAVPDGLSMTTISTTTRAEMPYLFALALADYFTFYKSQTKAEFGELFGTGISQQWIDLYWDIGKPIVRRARPLWVINDEPSIIDASNDIDAIATALGVRNH